MADAKCVRHGRFGVLACWLAGSGAQRAEPGVNDTPRSTSPAPADARVE